MTGEGVKSPQKGSMASDLRSLLSLGRTRWTKLLAYGFLVAFVGWTAFLAFNPSGNGSPWFTSLFTSSSISASIAPYRSHLNNFISHFFPNSSSSSPSSISPPKSGESVNGFHGIGFVCKNETKKEPSSEQKQANGGKGLPENQPSSHIPEKNHSRSQVPPNFHKGTKPDSNGRNQTLGKQASSEKKQTNGGNRLPGNLPSSHIPAKNHSKNEVLPNVRKETKPSSNGDGRNQTVALAGVQSKNQTNSSTKKGTPSDLSTSLRKGDVSGKKMEDWVKGMVGCDVFKGKWVKDESYPLYPEGSCPHIDEPFDCYLNGRRNRAYQKLRWQPEGCKIPRFNAPDLLERLRGKRLVFVGDSLNRNMWESLVCALRGSVKDKKKVVEASGRHEFRTEGSYSFLFKDYNCSVEFFRSPFLVQEWEMPDSNGKKKETLRLDIIERSSTRYKDANIIVFNTGHWWTHEKTSKGRDYYQVGNRIFGELNVVEAFHKALETWAKWVDTNVNVNKTLVFFRGYSASHFSGGQWNSGGACDRETEPIKNEKYLSPYPPKMRVLEAVIGRMKTPVSYLNITRMTDFRKDAHPSIYRKQNLTDEERQAPERFQDCSHWCLPGVPDSWNELLYAHILIKQHQMPSW
ncbi:hypothetical protein AXF42_Ash004135 [Apostasia shenzhenica]|uniref:Uncharacterized protein n=1 Tax=Apostasia shenzhenica TaxID=1088818 RepID=A0A2I0A232_9ASPA|nr:hypothetical protein AXF42_Ash004135 [Apostasia shenzhenica]